MVDKIKPPAKDKSADNAVIREWGKTRQATKIRDALDFSRKSLKPFLQFRTETFRTASGLHYGKRGADEKQPINMVDRALETYSRVLAARYPSVSMTSADSQRKAAALLFEIRIREEMKRCKIQKILQLTIQDAMVLYGINKVAEMESDVYYSSGPKNYSIGQSYIKRVSPDNFVFDMTARNWESCQFYAELVELDYEKMKASGKYKEISKEMTDESANDMDSASDLSRPRDVNSYSLYAKVPVWEVYIPRDHVIVTLPQYGGEIIRTEEYFGPEPGPYEMLAFKELADNIVPVSMAMSWIDLNEMVNTLVRKMMRQADRQKTIGVGRTGDQDSADVLRNSEDGQAYLVDNPDSLRELSLGGMRQENFAFTQWMESQLNFAMGNIELMAGTSAQTETARQERQLQQNSNVRIEDMRTAVEQFTERNLRKLVWYERMDKLHNFVIRQKLNGVSVELQDVLTPEMREADYDIEIVPFSMMPLSPKEQVEQLLKTVAEVVMPLQPILQQQGVTLDAVKLLQTIAEKQDIQELADIIVLQDPEAAQAGQGPGAGPVNTKPAQTSREYIRRSVGSQNNKAMESQLLQMAMQGGEQPSGDSQG